MKRLSVSLIVATALFGTAIVLFCILFNMGTFGTDIVATIGIGAILIFSALASWRSGRLSYVSTAWGFYLGTVSLPLVGAIDNNIKAPSHALDPVIAIFGGLLTVGLIMVTCALALTRLSEPQT